MLGKNVLVWPRKITKKAKVFQKKCRSKAQKQGWGKGGLCTYTPLVVKSKNSTET